MVCSKDRYQTGAEQLGRGFHCAQTKLLARLPVLNQYVHTKTSWIPFNATFAKNRFWHLHLEFLSRDGDCHALFDKDNWWDLVLLCGYWKLHKIYLLKGFIISINQQIFTARIPSLLIWEGGPLVLFGQVMSRSCLGRSCLEGVPWTRRYLPRHSQGYSPRLRQGVPQTSPGYPQT